MHVADLCTRVVQTIPRRRPPPGTGGLVDV